MKRSVFFVSAIFVLILTTAAGTVSAQSTNRNNPTPLTSNEVSGSFGSQERGNKEIFYSFTAGPGDLTITLDVKARKHGDSGGTNFELLERNGSTQLIYGGAQLGEGGTGRGTETVRLTRRQTVILHLTNSFYNEDGGLFNARLSGAGLSFNGSERVGGGYNDDNGRSNNNNDQELRNRGGTDQVEVPANGTLHIQMKNGTSQDINLSRVRNISVRP